MDKIEPLDEMTAYLNEVNPITPHNMDQIIQRYGVKYDGFPFCLIALKESLPADTVISDERVMTLFWWWSIETSFCYPKLHWRDDLTQEERMLLEKWDADITEEVEKGN